MILHLKISIVGCFAYFLSLSSAFAIDFDQDGLADFISINVNSAGQLEWSAIDLNDGLKKSLGQLGKSGDHLAVGEWKSDGKTSKAVISQSKSGRFTWTVESSSVQQEFIFGAYPAKVIAGLDLDNNGALDPVLVSPAIKNLAWQVMLNPGIATGKAAIKEYRFGKINAVPFYANPDGAGDQIATAEVLKNGLLNLQFKNLKTGKVAKRQVGNFRQSLSLILPVAQSDNRDILFAISQKGSRFYISIINGRRIIKRLQIEGDEIVVGRYLSSQSEVVAIRQGSDSALVIDSKGGLSKAKLDLSGILVDQININSFPDPELTPPENIVTPKPAERSPNPRCSAAVADSRQHLLYKPVSDTMGTTVLVFDSKYTTEFSSVKLQLKDGSFAEGWWKGLVLWGNPDAFGPRQHWRTYVKAAQVADNALIIANDGTQECRFAIPGSSSKRWE